MPNQPPRKILYHHRTRGDGAEGIHISEIVNALRALGHNVSVACPASARREPGLRGSNVPSSTSRSGSRFRPFVKQCAEIAYNAVSYQRVVKAIRREQPDFIYERYSPFHIGGIQAAKKMGLPMILEVNATYAGKFGARFPVCFPRTLRRMEDYVLTHANGIVVVSGVLEQCVRSRISSATPIQISPNAINLTQIESLDRSQLRQETRKRLGLNGKSVIGFVGSLRRWHGIDFLAEAMPLIHSQVPACHFLIVGTGEFEAELKQIIRSRNLEHVVTMPGAVSHHEVFPLIAATDIGVMADSNEFGSPMKILEYMAMGSVPVGPDLGPIEEIIDDGKTGRIFIRRDLDSFTKTIVDLCDNPETLKSIATAAHAYVTTERTWARNASQILELFERIGGDK